MLEFVKRCQDASPTPPAQQVCVVQLRKRRSRPSLDLKIMRPKSLLCSARNGAEDDTTVRYERQRSPFDQSNTWKFHRPRPRSYERYRFVSDFLPLPQFKSVMP